VLQRVIDNREHVLGLKAYRFSEGVDTQAAPERAAKVSPARRFGSANDALIDALSSFCLIGNGRKACP
jgi:hypothetical protein